MRENFDKSFDFIMKWEGGYVNDANDAGGETNFGISKSSYPNLDIQNLTIDKAKEIYLNDYWIKAECDMHQWPFDIMVFDAAINMGVTQARTILSLSDSWESYMFYRMTIYGLMAKMYSKFITGWTNRCKDLFVYIKKSML